MESSIVERKTHQVNLRIAGEEYTNLLILAKAVYDKGKIPDNKVASLLRWVIRNFQSQIAEQQIMHLQHMKEEKQKLDYMEFLRQKYGNTETMTDQTREINPPTANPK